METDTAAFYVKAKIPRLSGRSFISAPSTSKIPLRCAEYLARLVTPEPQTAYVPALWRYQDMRPLLMEAGDLAQRQGSGAPCSWCWKIRACAANRKSLLVCTRESNS